jgi:hypothetical protein
MFCELLQAAVRSGSRGYFETINGDEPPNAIAFGWVRQNEHDENGDLREVIVRPRTSKLGWIDPKEQGEARRLYLIEDVAVQVVGRFFSEIHSSAFPVQSDTLLMTLLDRGWIDGTEEKRDDGRVVRRPKVQKRIPALGQDEGGRGARRTWVVALRMDVFEGFAISDRAQDVRGHGDGGDTKSPGESDGLDTTPRVTTEDQKTHEAEDPASPYVREILADCSELDAKLSLDEQGRLVVTGETRPDLSRRIGKYYDALVAHLRRNGGRS